MHKYRSVRMLNVKVGYRLLMQQEIRKGQNAKIFGGNKYSFNTDMFGSFHDLRNNVMVLQITVITEHRY